MYPQFPSCEGQLPHHDDKMKLVIWLRDLVGNCGVDSKCVTLENYNKQIALELVFVIWLRYLVGNCDKCNNSWDLKTWQKFDVEIFLRQLPLFLKAFSVRCTGIFCRHLNDCPSH